MIWFCKIGVWCQPIFLQLLDHGIGHSNQVEGPGLAHSHQLTQKDLRVIDVLQYL